MAHFALRAEVAVAVAAVGGCLEGLSAACTAWMGGTGLGLGLEGKEDWLGFEEGRSEWVGGRKELVGMRELEVATDIVVVAKELKHRNRMSRRAERKRCCILSSLRKRSKVLYEKRLWGGEWRMVLVEESQGHYRHGDSC